MILMENFYRYFFFNIHFLKQNWPGMIKQKWVIFIVTNTFSASSYPNALPHLPSKVPIPLLSVCTLGFSVYQGLPVNWLYPCWTSWLWISLMLQLDLLPLHLKVSLSRLGHCLIVSTLDARDIVAQCWQRPCLGSQGTSTTLD